jgi:hypothetical protein
MLARDLFTETLLKQLPKNVVEIEYTKDAENYIVTEENDDDVPKTEALVQPTDVIDLISDDEDGRD